MLDVVFRSIVMCHFQSCPLESTLDVETFVGLTTVQDGLVTSDLVGDVVQGLNDAETELLPLLILGYCNVFNVPDETKCVDTDVD